MSKLDLKSAEQGEWHLAGVVFFGLVAMIVLWATVLIIRPFVVSIVLGAVLVTITFPIYERLRSRLRGRASLSAGLMVVGLVFVVLLPAVMLGGIVVQQARTVIADFQSGEAQRLLARVDIAGHLTWIRRFVPGFDPASLSPQRLLLPVVGEIPGWVARNGTAVLGGVAGALVAFAFVLLSSYFFYVEGEAILSQLALLSPLPQRYGVAFGRIFKDVIDATFRGQILTAVAQGILTGIGLAIAQVPSAFFWGAVASVMSLLPMVGAAAIWVPAAAYLYIAASTGDRTYFGAIFLTIWGLLVVSMVDNVVRPWTMRGKSQMSAIPLLVAVLGGMQAFGFIGMVLGPLVFSLLLAVIDIYRGAFNTESRETSSP